MGVKLGLSFDTRTLVYTETRRGFGAFNWRIPPPPPVSLALPNHTMTDVKTNYPERLTLSKCSGRFSRTLYYSLLFLLTREFLQASRCVRRSNTLATSSEESVLEKLLVAQLVKKSPHFTEPDISSPSSQKSTTFHSSQKHQSSTRLPIIFL